MVRCQYCGSGNVRSSRLRLGDWPQFFCLKLPIRCRDCNTRDYLSRKTVRRMQQSERAHHDRRVRRREAEMSKREE